MPPNDPFIIFRATTKWPWNGRKNCFYPRSKSWKSLIYHPMSTRGIPRHSVDGSRGRLKAWLITFNFGPFRAPPDPVIFLTEKLTTGCGTTCNAFWVIRTIWIAAECQQMTHLLFYCAAIEWPRNWHKSFSYTRSKSWESFIYHSMCPLKATNDIRCTGPVEV